ncbi:hypothetical protein [Actinomycetospora aeridis]|uniref:Uncharacterized protein n=1 Tax=Actinomycetospora aeridis TaxID=3129231 RepID=A0ABU8N2G0_9PSEU
MQLPDDTDLAAAVDARSRVPIARLRADWSANGLYLNPESDLTQFVQSVEVERALATDLPPEVSLVDGQSIAKLTATLKGRRRLSSGGYAELDIAQTLSPLRTDSPLYGVPLVGRPDVNLELGLRTAAGPRLISQFVGPVNTVDPRPDGTVELEALDAADRMRTDITLPAFIQYPDRTATYGNIFDVNTQWVVDFILRRNGIYASPPPRPGGILSVTGHGGAVAEVGHTRPPFGDMTRASGGLAFGGGTGALWTPGVFGLLANDGSWCGKYDTTGGYAGGVRGGYVQHYATAAIPLELGVGLQGWVYCGTSATHDVPGGLTESQTREVFSLFPYSFPDGYAAVNRKRISLVCRPSGGLGIRVCDGARNDLYSLPVSGAAAWRYVGVHVVWRGDGKVDIVHRVDGATVVRTSSVTYDFSTDQLLLANAQINTWCSLPWQDFQVWRAASPPSTSLAEEWPGETWTPQAEIGKGRNHLTYLPDVVGADSVELLDEVIGAEFGTSGNRMTDGQFFFRPRASLTASTAVKTVTADVSLLDLSMPTRVDSVRNIISVRAQAGYTQYEQEVLYDSQDPWEFLVPAYTIGLFEIPITAHTVPYLGFLTAQTPENYSEAASRGDMNIYCPLRTDNNLINTGVGAQLEHIAPRMARLRIRNDSGVAARLAAYSPTAGEPNIPALKVGCLRIEKRPEVQQVHTAPDSIAKYGSRTLPLALTEWRQRLDTLAPVAVQLRNELDKPVPPLTNIPIKGDPRLELFDAVRLLDPQGIAPSVTGRVVKIRRRATKTGLRDVIDLRPFPSTWPV